MAKRFEKHKFLDLMVLLVGFFLVFPFIQEYFYTFFVLRIFLSVIFIYALSKVMDSMVSRYLGCTLLILALGCNWFAFFVPVLIFKLLTDVFSFLFILFIIILMVRDIFSQNIVSSDTVLGAVCVYFLIGLGWADLFSLLENLSAHSFSTPLAHNTIALSAENFIYYSFVTLTTLGYGDIAPTTAPAKFLSILEAITGQLYIATTIARTLGMYLHHKKKN